MIGGERAGTLTVTVEGLFTVFEATANATGGLVRLAVYGAGEEGYLGVMQPWSEGLYLRRRMTRRELAAMPRNIEYAAPVGEGGRHEEARKEETSVPVALAEVSPVEAAEEVSEEVSGERDDELLWFTRPDGTLTAFDGKSSLVAIPAELRRNEPRTVLKELNGRTYMLFRY